MFDRAQRVCVLGVLAETRVLSLVAELSGGVGGLRCRRLIC